MFTRKSRFVALLILCVLLVQMLASCSLEVGPRPDPQPLDRDPYAKLDKYSYKIGNKSLVYNYSPDEEKALLSNIDRANRLLENGNAPDTFINLYMEIDEQYSRLMSQAQIAYIEYCMMETNQEVKDNYLHVNELRTAVLQDLIVMYRTIYDSPYRDVFYEGWTEEEIRQALDEADLFTDEFAALNNKSDELLVAYRELDPSIPANKAKIRELYLEFANVQNDIAVQLGYSNYMEYAYSSVYSRDYTYEQAGDMANLVFNELLPYVERTYNKFQFDMNYLYENKPDVYNEFLVLYQYQNIGSAGGQDILKGYCEALGEEPARIWNELMDGGNYFIVSASTAYDGAFSSYIYDINEPMVYFGPNYRSLSTAVHEFGHYMAFIRGREGARNYDLAETHSQGNEMLFSEYLYQDYSKEAIDFLITYNTLNSFITLVSACAVNQFETYVYTHLDSIEADDLDGIYQDVLATIPSFDFLDSLTGGGLQDYWYYVTLESPGYYISYAISLVASLELLAVAHEDFEQAKEIYLDLGAADTPEFCAELEEAGLYTPFDARTYDMITAMFEELLVPISVPKD